MFMIYSGRCFVLALFLFAVMTSRPAQAQKEVLYSQYLLNTLSINPAYAGSRESFHLTAFLRRKWISARNAPVTQSVSMDGAVAGGRVGLGFQALNDRSGLFQATGFYGSAAYRFNLPALAKLSIGVQGGVSILPYTSLSSASLNQTIGSFGIGIYYQSDRFFGGLSMPELSGKLLGQTAQFQYQSVRPVLIQAGMKFPVSDNAVLIPSVLVTSVSGRPLGVDLNAKIWFNEQFGLGLSYRHNSPGIVQTSYLQASAEYQLTKSIRLGYIYYSQTPESPNASQFDEKSIHEIMFRFSPNILGFSY